MILNNRKYLFFIAVAIILLEIGGIFLHTSTPVQALTIEERIEALEKRQLPVGYVYISKNPTDPGTFLGGTWQRIANGRCLVTVDNKDSDFSNAKMTGGVEKVSLTTAQMPRHMHTGNTSESGSHSHMFAWWSSRNEKYGGYSSNAMVKNQGYYTHRLALIGRSSPTDSTGNHEHSFTTENTGKNEAHNNMQPYYTAYIWEKVR